jgi:hypothetical protein
MRVPSDLAKARRVIEVQGNVSALLEQLATGSADHERPTTDSIDRAHLHLGQLESRQCSRGR